VALVDVAALDDLEEGTPHIVRVGRREIALVQWKDRVFAVRNVCPHQTQSFARGITRPLIERTGAQGTFAVHHDRPVIACPWHRWEYELSSGRCVIDPRVRIRSYPTVIDNERVFVDV